MASCTTRRRPNETKKLQREELDNRRERSKQLSTLTGHCEGKKFLNPHKCLVSEVTFGVTKTVKITKLVITFFMRIF